MGQLPVTFTYESDAILLPVLRVFSSTLLTLCALSPTRSIATIRRVRRATRVRDPETSRIAPPLLLAERFGTRDYGRIYSTSQMMTVLGVAGCPALIGVLYEMSGGYQQPFFVISALTLVGFAVLAVFAVPRRATAV